MYEPAPLPKGTGGTWGGNPKRFGGQEGEEMASTSVGNPGNVRMGTETHWTPKDAVSDQVAQAKVQARGGDAGIARYQPRTPDAAPPPRKHDPAPIQPSTPGPAKRPSERMAPKGPDDPVPEGLRPHIIDFDPVNFRAKGEAYNPGKPIPSSAEKKIPPLPTP